MTCVKANVIEIEVERHGADSAVPLLLVRGLGTQLINWPPALVDGFVANGFHVVTFDNRDSGLSQKFDGWGLPDLDAIGDKIAAATPVDLPYTLDDMAADGIGLLDALEIPVAHVLGMSMGGMIVQLMAHHYPDRIGSATIVMSTSGNADLPARAPEIERLLTAQTDDSDDREQAIEHALHCDRAWGSSDFPFDPHERRKLIGRAYDRCYCPGGVSRQYAAMVASASRVEQLRDICAPVLVVHGTGDLLLPIEHGRDIAANIAGSELIEVDGMGHDLEGVSEIIVAATTRLATKADSSTGRLH